MNADSDQDLNANMQMNGDETSNVNMRMNGEQTSNVDMQIKRSDSKKCSKLKGTKKVNGFCPASIKLTCSEETGKCQVKFIKTHIGHSNDWFLPSEKQSLVAKIPFDAILDNVGDSISDSGLERIHLLTKMDLHKIQSSFNLNSDVQSHKDDGTSVEAWVNEMNTEGNSCVLFYKPQNSIDENFGELQSNDFVLIVMNETQQELLKNFGNDCICIDRTHVMNNYDFELITLLVIDDMRQGFPDFQQIRQDHLKIVF
ncbi:hypothetical protein AVEN_240803-1 [Araneus ventricosus]|uniref:Uncharacterized protein n=1 Tax=Araneus ventricosus TaxID=182803 RepID=A0A4Y2S2A9_ARAVE|nr:hypothetical protein AVEN_240803-1 [Araneus ventricosus]